MIIILSIFLIMQTSFDWEAAERAVKEERAKSVAYDTMRSDTTIPDYQHLQTPKKQKPSTHTVTIYDTKKIDSIQAVEDSLSLLLYSDKQFKKMRYFDITNRINFFNHLLHYKIKDTASVYNASTIYINILDCQYKRLLLILDKTTDDTRAAIYLHIKKNRNDAGVIGGYLYLITK